MWEVIPGKDSRRDGSEAEKGRERGQQRCIIKQLSTVAIGADLLGSSGSWGRLAGSKLSYSHPHPHQLLLEDCSQGLLMSGRPGLQHLRAEAPRVRQMFSGTELHGVAKGI